MADRIILKNSGVFVADDYQGLERASGRLLELAEDIQQPIQRRSGRGFSDEQNVEAHLVSYDHYKQKKDAFDSAGDYGAPFISVEESELFDDDLGRNITKYIDLIQGRSQVLSGLPEVVRLGTSLGAYRNISFKDSAKIIVDNATIVREDGKVIGGNKLGILVHPDVHNFIESITPEAITFVGTGNGTISDVSMKKGSIDEEVTVEMTNAGTNISEIQTLSFDIVPDDGDFSLELNGETSPIIAFDAVAADVEAAIESFTEINDVTVTGDFTAGFEITFNDPFANIDQLAVATNTLTSGGSPVTITVATTQEGSSAGDATWTVDGSISGSMGTAVTGQLFEGEKICFLIEDGSTPFEVGDTFTIQTVEI